MAVALAHHALALAHAPPVALPMRTAHTAPRQSLTLTQRTPARLLPLIVRVPIRRLHQSNPGTRAHACATWTRSDARASRFGRASSHMRAGVVSDSAAKHLRQDC